MYCSSCGKAVNQGLSYCNHCGARANDAKEPTANKLSESSFNLLLAGILGIPIAGFGVIIGLMSVMKEIGFSSALIIAFTFLSFLPLLAAEATFIWSLVQNRTRPFKETGDDAQLKEAVIKGLGSAQVRELSEPIQSVTEHTTRSFEPRHREPNTR